MDIKRAERIIRLSKSMSPQIIDYLDRSGINFKDESKQKRITEEISNVLYMILMEELQNGI